MRYSLQHIIYTVLCMSSLLLMPSACSNDIPLSNEENDGKAILIVNTDIIGTRAGEDVLSAEEKMKTLRMIILHEDGTVEHNEFMDFSSPLEKYEKWIAVKRNETKKIYLIANEGSLGGNVDLNDLGTDPAGKLEGITFNVIPDSPTGNPASITEHGIPMSACYSLEVGNESRIEKTFWLVRAMTKFTFSFINERADGPITIKDMKVSSFTDEMYLMPQLYNNEGTAVPSEKFTVLNNTKTTIVGEGDKAYEKIEPVYKENDDYNGTYSTAESSTFWIDWLKQAVDWSQTGEYPADEIGWIHQYNVPKNASHNYDKTGIEIKPTDDFQVELSAEGRQYPQAFYRSESANNPTADTQHYQIDYLEITWGEKQETKYWENTPVLNLTNVRYLFRHTHVKVNVKFSQTDVVIFARIHPWKISDPTDPRPFEPID